MQLIYRAARFNYAPAAVTPSTAIQTTMHQLQYRGMEFTYRKPVEVGTVAPKAMNWRVAQVCQSAAILAPAHA